jgi:hypothetical protein
LDSISVIRFARALKLRGFASANPSIIMKSKYHASSQGFLTKILQILQLKV